VVQTVSEKMPTRSFALFYRHTTTWVAAFLLYAAMPARGACPSDHEATEAAFIQTATGTIHGSLRLPSTGKDWPVVLIVSGSGPTDRDGNNALLPGRNDSLKWLASSLADAGIASLRYDKRGVCESRDAALSEVDLRFEHYVQDAAQWLQKLKADARFSGVAILGHSEGSLIAMLAAQQGPAQALVSIAGPAEQASNILRKQLLGLKPPSLADTNERLLSSLESGVAVPEVPAELSAIYRPSVQPYLISWFKYTPSTVLALTRLPTLIVQGNADVQVRIEQALALHAAQPNAELLIVNGMNHVLKSAPQEPSRQMEAYSNPSLPLAKDMVAGVTGFLSRTLNAPQR
jgi:uncharacterized protein